MRVADLRKFYFPAFEREVVSVAMHTTGMFPSEFDPTTNAVLRTIQHFGTTDDELRADQEFLVNMMELIGSIDAVDIFTPDETIAVMDLVYIGLIYHRHIPFVDDDTNEVFHPVDDPVGYTDTLSILATALIDDMGVSMDDILEASADSSHFVLPHLRPPDSIDEEGTRLHVQFLALAMIGMLVHRFVPTIHARPRKE